MRVLYIEDNSQDADLTLRALQRKPGVTVTVVSTQRAAEDKLRRPENYDLVLTDMNLPDGNGLALLTYIRGRSLPLAVVLVTGAGDEEIAVASLRGGADDYIVKRAGYLKHLPDLLRAAWERHQAQARSENQPIRVLYAEHHADDRDLTMRHLQRLSPHIALETVPNAAAFLERMRQATFDVLLVDYKLPGMNALELLQVLKQEYGEALPPMVFVTGQGHEEVVIQAIRLGAADYVAKQPGYLNRLAYVLENAFHRARIQREHQSLLASEARYRTLFNGVPVGLYRSTPDGRLLDANPAMAHLLGYKSLDELLTIDLHTAYVNPADREQFQQVLASHGEVQGFEVRMQRRDGSVFWGSLASRLVREGQDPQVEYYDGSLQDITSSKLRQRELESIAEFGKALRTATSGETMYPLILDFLMNTLVIQGAALGLVDTPEGDLFFPLGVGLWSGIAGLRLPPGVGVSGEVLSSGKPYISENVQADPRHEYPERHENLPAAACVPLTAEDKSVGVVWIGADKPVSKEDLYILSAIAEIAAIAIQREGLFDALRSRASQLQAMHAIDTAISSNTELAPMFAVIFEECRRNLEVDTILIWKMSADGRQLLFRQQMGATVGMPPTMTLVQHPASGILDPRMTSLLIPDLRAWGLEHPDANLSVYHDNGIQFYCGVPLIVKGERRGLIEFCHTAVPDSYKNQPAVWLNFAESVAGQAAVAMENAGLFRELREALERISTAYDETLEGWARALELRDQETAGHSQRVTELAVAIAREMGITGDALVAVRRGALLHDIGKMGIPDAILHKPGPLTESEWRVMRQHPVFAYQLLQPIEYLHDALDIPYCHHERWNGSGYPRGLRGTDIPLPSRIFAVVDVWDALLSDRSYRSAWSSEKVRAYINEQDGVLFDPEVVTVLWSVLGKMDDEHKRG